MQQILKVNRPDDFMSYVGAEGGHPLVGVIDYAEVSPVPHTLNSYGVYGLFMHSNIPDGLTYGCGSYGYREGTLICVAPGQIGGMEDNGELIELDGWALLFHPDILKGTHLEKEIRKYSFFDYSVNEALHMSEQESSIIASLMRHIKTETQAPADHLQNNILVGYITVMLDYCRRFYDRQFSMRGTENTDMLMRFDALLSEYFDRGMQARERPARRALLRRTPRHVAQLFQRHGETHHRPHRRQHDTQPHHPPGQKRTESLPQHSAGSLQPRL